MKIVVVGAGVAGCTTAKALQEAGHLVYLIDQRSGCAKETSAHAGALAHPHLTRVPIPLQTLTRIACDHAYSKWHKQRLHTGAFLVMSLEKWVDDSTMVARLKRLSLGPDHAQLFSSEAALEKTGVFSQGVWYPKAGVYDLAAICEDAIKDIPAPHRIWNSSVSRMMPRGREWVLFDQVDREILSADAVVLAGSFHTKALLDKMGVDITLRSVRGQLSRFAIAKTSAWYDKMPKFALTGEGYCVPPVKMGDGRFLWQVGSSYHEGDEDLRPRDECDQHNREQAQRLINRLELPTGDLEALDPFVGVRCVARDRMPMIGPIGALPGVFVSTAYGARGVLWSAIAPSLVERQIHAYFAGEDLLRAGFLAGADATVEADFALAVTPARFLAGTFSGRASNSKPILPSGCRAK